MSFLACNRRCPFAYVKSIAVAATAAMPVSKCCSSVLTSTVSVKLRFFVFTRRRFATSQGSASSDAPEAAIERKLVSHSIKTSSSSSSDKSNREVEPINLHDAAFQNAIFKVYCTHAKPDYSCPWQKQRQYRSTGSAFAIGDGKLLTNAHCVEHETQVKVLRRGDDTKYVAKVLARGADCDIALLSVESKKFWEGVKPLSLGGLPHLQDSVSIVGYPRGVGEDTISITKGVVSRIQVISYARGSNLLGIRIDVAINPGTSGGPAFNDEGECIGVAFEVHGSENAKNIGYLIPTTVVSHFLNDYERNKKYTGFPCLDVLFQKLENPALRKCLKVKSKKGQLVRRIKPTSCAYNVLKEGDVIVSIDDINVGYEGKVPFRLKERVSYQHLISQKFAGDVAELGIIRAGESMKVKVVLNPPVHLVPYHIDGGLPSYLIIAGLVFTPFSRPLLVKEGKDSIGLKLLAKTYYSPARFKGEQIVILSQVLAHEVNTGSEDRRNLQVLKLNGTRIKNIHHLAHLVDSCKDKYLVFEFEDNSMAVFEREAATAASSCIMKENGIPSERSADMLEPFVDSPGDNQEPDQEYGDSPVSNYELGFDGLLWA